MNQFNSQKKQFMSRYKSLISHSTPKKRSNTNNLLTDRILTLKLDRKYKFQMGSNKKMTIEKNSSARPSINHICGKTKLDYGSIIQKTLMESDKKKSKLSYNPRRLLFRQKNRHNIKNMNDSIRKSLEIHKGRLKLERDKFLDRQNLFMGNTARGPILGLKEGIRDLNLGYSVRGSDDLNPLRYYLKNKSKKKSQINKFFRSELNDKIQKAKSLKTSTISNSGRKAPINSSTSIKRIHGFCPSSFTKNIKKSFSQNASRSKRLNLEDGCGSIESQKLSLSQRFGKRRIKGFKKNKLRLDLRDRKSGARKPAMDTENSQKSLREMKESTKKLKQRQSKTSRDSNRKNILFVDGSIEEEALPLQKQKFESDEGEEEKENFQDKDSFQSPEKINTSSIIKNNEKNIKTKNKFDGSLNPPSQNFNDTQTSLDIGNISKGEQVNRNKERLTQLMNDIEARESEICEKNLIIKNLEIELNINKDKLVSKNESKKKIESDYNNKLEEVEGYRSEIKKLDKIIENQKKSQSKLSSDMQRTQLKLKKTTSQQNDQKLLLEESKIQRIELLDKIALVQENILELDGGITRPAEHVDGSEGINFEFLNQRLTTFKRDVQAKDSQILNYSQELDILKQKLTIEEVENFKIHRTLNSNKNQLKICIKEKKSLHKKLEASSKELDLKSQELLKYKDQI